MAQLSDYQRDVLIRTALGEARGEGVEGMADVLQVIMNRAESGKYPSDPAKVALQKNNRTGIHAFSAWNNESQGGNRPQQFGKGSDLYKQAERALDMVVSGERPDYTGGALFYHTPAVNPYWAKEANTHGTIQRNGHIFYPSRPTPPGEVPNVVASRTDTTPETRDVPSPRPRPAQRPDIMQALTPKMIPQGVNYPFLPQMTNTSVTRGFGSLTPNAVQETMPSEIPQTAMLPNTRPANVPLPRPRPGMPVVPYEQGQTIATVATPQRQRLPELPPSAIAPRISPNSPISPTGPGPTSLATVQDMYGRPPRPSRLDPIGVGPNSLASVQDMYGRPGGVGQPPATRSVPSVPVPASPAMGMTTDRGAMPTRSAFLSEFGLANPRETLAAPLPTTAVPGPRRVGSNERLGPGIPVASATASGLGQLFPPTPYYDVSTALDVVPDAVPRMPIGPGLPPPPIPRPLRSGVNVQMPTPMGQRPTLPMPRANPFAMPTPVAQRPNPNALRVTVNGAGSYNAPQRAPTPTREQMLAAIRARSRGPTAFGHGGTIDGAVQPIGTLSGRR